MVNGFPDFEKHEDVECFMCRHKIVGAKPEPSGYPVRYGAWLQQCQRPGCGMVTYYDLKEAHEPEADR